MDSEEIIGSSVYEESKNKMFFNRININKLILAIYVVFLVFLCFFVSCGLFLFSKDYLIWAANEHKAECDLQQLQENVKKERIVIEDEIKRLEEQKKAHLSSLAEIREIVEQLNQQVAEREAFLNTSNEEKKRLDILKLETENLRKQNEQLIENINQQNQDLSKLIGQKELLTGQHSDLSSRLETLREEQETLVQQIAKSKLILSESEQIRTEVQEKQQQVANIREQMKTLQQELLDLTTLKSTINEEISTLRQKQITATTDLQTQVLMIKQKEIEVDTLEKSKISLQQEVSKLQAEKTLENEKVTQINEQVQKAIILRDKVTQENTILNEQQERLNQEISLLRARIENELKEKDLTSAKSSEDKTQIELSTAEKSN